MTLAKTAGSWLGGLIPSLARLGREIGVVDTTVAKIQQGITQRLQAKGLWRLPAGADRGPGLPRVNLLDIMRTVGSARRTIRGLADQVLALASQIAHSIHEGELETYAYARYAEPFGDLPRQVSGLPLQEIMLPSKLGGMIQRGAEYARSQFQLVDRYLEQIARLALGKDGDPFKAFVHGDVQPPPHVLERWREDAEFCRQLIQGVNPLVIRAVQSTCQIPKAMRGLCAQGMSLQELIGARRLFILDYDKLAPLQRYRNMVFYAPIALVYRETLAGGSSRLNLLGIQLTRHEGSDNVVYTPDSSPENRYLYAKIQLACADNQYHQFISHLGLAHLAAEPLAIAHHNVFMAKENSGHLIGKLLAPHFEETIAINFLARQTLVADPEVAFTDRTFAPGTRQALQLFLSAWREYDFVKNSFPHELASRGFDEKQSDGVAHYYYREDGFSIWHALHRYVGEVVAAVYGDDAAVSDDPVLQRWAFECSAKDRADIPGFPRAIASRQELVETLTTIVFQVSAFHSAVNFPQRDYITYVPNRPDATFAEMPPGEEDITMDFILLQGLPDFFASNFQISFAHLLTLPSDKPLTRLPPVVAVPPFVEIHERFQEALHEIRDRIEARNRDLAAAGKQPYTYLRPDLIASSVAI
jgi:arachidonate 5-lipoxygenase